jgi:hypothetical protein
MRLSFVIALLWCSLAMADETTMQGRITNAAGNSVDGSYSLTLALYTSQDAEKAAFSQSLDNVAVVAGVFSLTLVLPTEIVASSNELWIGISVDGEEELTRRPVGRVPFAMRSSDLACSACVGLDELGFAVYTQSEINAMVADFVTVEAVADLVAQGILENLNCQEGQVVKWVSQQWQCASLGPAVIIPTIDGAFLDFALQFISAMPGKGGNGFVVPNDLERNIFAQAVDALVAEDLLLTQTLAALVDYELLLIKGIWVLRPVAGKDKGRGLYGLASSSKRNLVVSAPHPKYDTNTGIRVAEAFEVLSAKAFAIAGTHRCANAAESGCSGSTSACGSLAPYRESDQAHTEKGFFQVFHEQVSPGRTTLQFHGFKSNADDPEFTFSDGTTINSNEPNHLGNLLTVDLESKIAAAGSAKPGNSCNRVGDINKLCGSTNTQGRFLNGVVHNKVCTTSTSVSNQSFIHMELSFDLRNKGGLLEPQLIYDAVKAVIPEQ